MKPVFILVLSYVCNIYARDAIKIELKNVGGVATLGDVPRPLTGPGYFDEVETANLKEVLDMLRRMASVGVREMPPFDPYKVSSLKNVEIKSVPGLKANLDLSNVVVEGLRNYEFVDVLLQTENISVSDGKLFKFTQEIPKLTFNADVVGNLSLFDMQSESVTAKLSGAFQNLVLDGSIGFEKIYDSESRGLGVPHFESNSYEILAGMDKLKLNLHDIKTRSGRSRAPLRIPRYDYHPLAKELAGIIGSEVLKQINKVLRAITAEQVDAFLFPYYQ